MSKRVFVLFVSVSRPISVLAVLAVAAASLAGCGDSTPAAIRTDGGDASAVGDAASDGAADVSPGLDAPTSADADAAQPSDVATVSDAGDAGDAGPVTGSDAGGAKTLSRIEVSPPAATLAKGTGLPLIVTADYSDGSSNDVGALATLTSSAPTVASVSGQTVTALASGTATITATYMGETATVAVTVTAATLQSIAVDPMAPTLAAGTTVPLVATGIFSDGSKQDVSQLATWTSSDGTIAVVKVSTAGVALSGIKAGSATLTAALLTLSTTVNATVTSAVVESIGVTPSHPTIPVGITSQFQATATYSDNTTQDVSAQATWTVSDSSIAAVDATGDLTTKAMGSVDVQAAFGGAVGKTTTIVMGTTLESIKVTPVAVTAPAGIPEPFTAMGTYSDGSTVDITQSVSWSTDAAAASVSNATGGKGVATGLSAGTAHVQAQLGTVTGAATFTISSAIVTSLSVLPKSATLPVGFTQVLTATATYSDATTRDVTTLAVWSSSDPTLAAVANATSGGVASGTVTSVKPGMVTVTASFGGASDTAQVTTTVAVITEIDVAPTTAATPAGGQQKFTATAKISDGTTSDVTTQVTWSSSDAAVVAVSNASGSKGLATSLKPGAATITATLDGKRGQAQFTVSAPALAALQVTPFTATIKVGATQAFTVTAIFTDGSTQDVTATVQWSVSDASVASISTTAMMMMGMPRRATATGLAAGTATVQATYMGLSASALLTVTAPLTLVTIIVTPDIASVRVGQTQAYEATAVYSDGTTTNVTATSSWTSSDTTVATVGSMVGMGMGMGGRGGGPAGTASGVAAGTVTLTGTYMNVAGTAKLTVTAPLLTGIEVNPPIAALVIGQSQQFQATALYDDGSRQMVTATALWSSSATNVLEISDATAGGSGTPKGDAVALAAGSATVTASYLGFSSTAAVTVSAPTLVAVQVTPTNPTLGKGASLQFQAVALYSDFSTVNVTSSASWTSSSPAVATITNTAPGRGRVNALGTGQATITATYSGISGSTALTVTNPQVMAIEVTPASPTVPVGIDERFKATAMLTDGSTLDVTTATTWTSSDATVASISNAAGAQGLATPLVPGTVTVTATYMGMMATTTLTVSTASLLGIAVSGIAGELAVGAHLQLNAIASYDDGSMVDITDLATWISTMTGVATASNATGSQGLVTGVAAGTTSIEAHWKGMVGSASLTVGP
jgi:trimeric autotransporter adhesin